MLELLLFGKQRATATTYKKLKQVIWATLSKPASKELFDSCLPITIVVNHRFGSVTHERRNGTPRNIQPPQCCRLEFGNRSL
jgi:hypothetical protein